MRNGMSRLATNADLAAARSTMGSIPIVPTVSLPLPGGGALIQPSVPVQLCTICRRLRPLPATRRGVTEAGE